MLLCCNSSDLLFVKELSLAVPKLVGLFILRNSRTFSCCSHYIVLQLQPFSHMSSFFFSPLIRHFCLVCCGVVLAS